MGIKAELDQVQSANPAVLAAMRGATIGAGAGDLGGVPGTTEFVNAAMAFAGRLSEAATAVAGALNAAGAMTIGGAGTGSPIDDAALKAALAKVRAALPIRPLIDQVEKIVTNKDLNARIKAHYASVRKPGDMAPVRAALKQVQPSHVAAFKVLSAALEKLQAHEQVATVPALKASLSSMEGELRSILADFGRDVERLVKVCDTWVASFE